MATKLERSEVRAAVYRPSNYVFGSVRLVVGTGKRLLRRNALGLVHNSRMSWSREVEEESLVLTRGVVCFEGAKCNRKSCEWR